MGGGGGVRGENMCAQKFPFADRKSRDEVLVRVAKILERRGILTRALGFARLGRWERRGGSMRKKFCGYFRAKFSFGGVV